jgi:hypothetical protein
MKAFSLLCALAMLALTGCGTMDVDVTSWERSTLLAGRAPLSQVRLSARMLTHNDLLVFAGVTNQIASEKIFRAVFTGNEDAPASLDLVRTGLRYEVPSLFKRVVVSYEIEVLLKLPDGTRQNLRATADVPAMIIDSGIREAIERATLDLARQCEVKLGAK